MSSVAGTSSCGRHVARMTRRRSARAIQYTCMRAAAAPQALSHLPLCSTTAVVPLLCVASCAPSCTGPHTARCRPHGAPLHRSTVTSYAPIPTPSAHPRPAHLLHQGVQVLRPAHVAPYPYPTSAAHLPITVRASPSPTPHLLRQGARRTSANADVQHWPISNA